jgi:hypothetical protein
VAVRQSRSDRNHLANPAHGVPDPAAPVAPDEAIQSDVEIASLPALPV